MPRTERILLWIAAFVCLTFVLSLRDSGSRVVPFRLASPPVPQAITDRPGRVVATIENADGGAVSGASVRLLSIQDERAYLAGAARTDRAGRAELPAIPRGEAWILAEGEGFARASTRLVVDDAPREVKLRLRPASILRAKVVDDGGAPIADAWVEARSGDPLPFVTKSDAEGHAEIARLGPPPWSLRVKAVGYGIVTEIVSKTSPDTKVTLRKLGNISVATVTAEGDPVGEATVLVAGSGLWPARKVMSDAQGHAKVPDLPRGIYDLRASRGDWVSPAEMGIALGRGESKSLTLTLVVGRRVAVRVTDDQATGRLGVLPDDGEDGAPLPGASVVLVEGGVSSFPFEATTDARGAASLGPIAPGPAFLSARADGFVSKTGLPVPPGASPAVRVGLVRGAVLLGDVVDARGFPIDGATVEVIGTAPNGEPIDESPERTAFRAAHFSWALGGPRTLVPAGDLGVMPGPLPSVPHAGSLPANVLRPNGDRPPPEPWVSRDDGSFRAFPVPPGRVRALVRHPSYVEGVSDVVTLGPGGESRVRVVLRGGGALEGRVVDDRQAPVSGARVDIASAKGALERTTVTADDGTFAFAGVPGDVVLAASRPGASEDIVVRTNVTIKEGERKEVEIVLPRERDPMTIEVTDDRGTPLDGAQVLVLSLAPDAPLRRTLFTGRDGRAIFKDAVGLPVRISVARRERAPEVRDVDPAPAELRFELAGGAHLEGTVTARRGHDAVEGAEVTLYAPTGPAHARTDRDGSYRFDDVAPGVVRLVVVSAGHASAERPLRIEAPTRPDRLVAVDPIDLAEGATVEGDVVAQSGEPVSGARVGEAPMATSLPTGKLPRGVVLTDRRGAFKIDDLREGDLVLEAIAPDIGSGRSASVRTTAGRPVRGVRITLSNAADDVTGDTTASGGVAISLDDSARTGIGVAVVLVARESEAERAGVQAGDRIVSIDGRAVSSAKDAKSRLFGPVADDVVIEILRGDERQRLRVAREKVHP